MFASNGSTGGTRLLAQFNDGAIAGGFLAGLIALGVLLVGNGDFAHRDVLRIDG